MSTQEPGSSLSRIGKALIKFFKPIRVVAPHSTSQQSRQGLPPAKEFRLLNFKKTRDPQAEAKARARSGTLPVAADDYPPLPESARSNWLELVVYLLSACRKVSNKMRVRVGLDTYREAMTAKGKARLKAVGSIIDTTPVDERTRKAA